MKEITELEIIKINNEEHYVYRFGCFFSAGVSEIDDDYGFRFLVTKDLSKAILANHEGKTKVVTVEEVVESIKAIKVLSNVTDNIYGGKIVKGLVEKPPKPNNIVYLNFR